MAAAAAMGCGQKIPILQWRCILGFLIRGKKAECFDMFSPIKCSIENMCPPIFGQVFTGDLKVGFKDFSRHHTTSQIQMHASILLYIFYLVKFEEK